MSTDTNFQKNNIKLTFVVHALHRQTVTTYLLEIFLEYLCILNVCHGSTIFVHIIS